MLRGELVKCGAVEILSQAHLSPSCQKAYAEHLTQARQPVFAHIHRRGVHV